MNRISLTEAGKYILDDIVAAVIALVPESRGDKFDASTRQIHDAFRDMREHYPILKDQLSFSQEDVFPFSRQLEEAFATLELSRIIGMENPDYTRYLIKPGGRSFVKDRLLPLFAEEEQQQLRDMAEVFAQRCKVQH